MDSLSKLWLVPMPVAFDGSEDVRRQQYMAEETLQLVARVILGDELAMDVLHGRLVNPLLRWARMRLSTGDGQQPAAAALPAAVERVVGETTRETLKKLSEQPKRESTLWLGLRTALHKQLRAHQLSATALVATIGKPQADAYEVALARLDAMEQEAVVCYLEFQHDFKQLQKDLGLPAEDRARATYARGIVQLAQEMRHGR